MAPVSILIGFCWLIFLGVWIVYGLKARKTVHSKKGPLRFWIVLGAMASILLLLAVRDIRQLNTIYLFPAHSFAEGFGVILCVCGTAFAIWARVHLGQSWGMPMSNVEKPALITTGPYHFVRHPIYTGLCTMMTGTILNTGIVWNIWYLIWIVYFIYSAKQEEKAMLLQFPEVYPTYRKRTRMLIPFIL